MATAVAPAQPAVQVIMTARSTDTVRDAVDPAVGDVPSHARTDLMSRFIVSAGSADESRIAQAEQVEALECVEDRSEG